MPIATIISRSMIRFSVVFFMICSFLVAIVVVARLAIVAHTTGKKLLDERSYLAAASAYNPYMVLFERAPRTFAHIAGEHNIDTHTLEYGRYARFATASLRRREFGRRDYRTLVVGDKNGVVVAVPEVIIYAPLACWNYYLHALNFEGLYDANIRKKSYCRSKKSETV